ncbi:nucleotidyltransferase family protein [Silicimonas algicola]|nr:NTP transferase domain-containing protein [Silicimonas algicola]AZQ66118.1 nucleotidyltransferase family protein [Silicimonas algicola]
MSPLVVIPAAGASARMRGGDKLLETIEGEALLRRQAVAATATGCAVAVTLPPGPSARRACLGDVPVAIVDVPDHKEGMSASLRRAAGLLVDGQALAVLLPDVPGIGAGELIEVLQRFRSFDGDRVVRGGTVLDARPGTPLFLPHRVARRFLDLAGDDGGRQALAGEAVEFVRFPDDRAVRDLDTPEDWAAWRAETGIAE